MSTIKKTGQYSDISFLKRGGCSYILKAKQNYTNRYVAIKTLIPGSRDILKQRIYNEAKILSSLDHTNIVKIFDVQDSNESIFFVMELLQGYSLQDYIIEYGPLDIQTAIPIIKQICLAISYIHQKNIVHRDIKPSNIFLTESGCVKLIDFGMSIFPESNCGFYKQYLSGTIDYAAPEFLTNPYADKKDIDIYSLGATLYFLFFGTTIYSDVGRNSKIRKKLYGFYPKFNFINDSLDILLHDMLSTKSRPDNIDIVLNRINLINTIISYNIC